MKGKEGGGKGEGRGNGVRYWLLHMGRGRGKRGSWGEGMVRGLG